MYDPKRKFERPRKARWTYFWPAGEYHMVTHCGSDPLCRRGRARFRIVAFGPYPWCYGGAPAPSPGVWLKYPPKPTWTLCNP